MNKLLLLISVFSFAIAQDCCEAEQEAIDNCGGLGCFIPQCTDDCEWESMQCWSSTGYCWCVDENGVEIDGTSQPSWQGLPECETEILLGDVNFDEQVDVLDIVILVSFILMTDSPTDVEFIASDYNGDGDINVMDIIIIIEYILN